MRKQPWMPEGIVTQLERYEFALKKANQALAALMAEQRTWEVKLDEQAALKLDQPDRIFDLRNGWACPESPIGVCVYEDYCNEWCIYCEEPEERK